MAAESILGLMWESDIDLLLVLDALATGPITAALYEAGGLAAPGQVDQVARSFSRDCDGRETDVLIRADTGTLLIENKIDALFQPGQPESYRAEVQLLRGRGERSAAVLVAPDRRIPALRAESTDCFDGHVAIEGSKPDCGTTSSSQADNGTYTSSRSIETRWSR